MAVQRLQVESLKQKKGFSYPIVFEKDFYNLSEEIEHLNWQGRKICLITDSNVAPLYLEEVKKALEASGKTVTSYILPAGESNKNLTEIQGIYEHLIQNGFDRKDLLAALGGGVVGDMTGFAAATYLRGIDFIQIPTTLLSQVDSSIGGKTGVDFKQYKNMVGAFHQPRLVYTNVSVLRTLPEREFSCGMGEILKHGYIKDSAYSLWLNEHLEAILDRDLSVCQEMIFRSCQIKQAVVENDPTEQGERALLNFGHTIGHAIEKLKDFTLLHGECVSIGCVSAAYLSMQHGGLSVQDYQYVKSQLQSFRLPTTVSGLSREAVLKATKSDKKMEGGKIKFILLDSVGHAFVNKSLSDQDLLEAIQSVLEEDPS